VRGGPVLASGLQPAHFACASARLHLAGALAGPQSSRPLRG
jgi:hypothetical protein